MCLGGRIKKPTLKVGFGFLGITSVYETSKPVNYQQRQPNLMFCTYAISNLKLLAGLKPLYLFLNHRIDG
jgi:hypothetical protein